MDAKIIGSYKVAFFFILVLQSGCTPFGGFKAPPKYYEVWMKKNADVVEVQKAIMECGFPNPYDNEYLESKDYYDSPLWHKCMINSGFEYIGENYDKCKLEKYKTSKACLPETPIPVRSVERRLSSNFCKKYPANETFC